MVDSLTFFYKFLSTVLDRNTKSLHYSRSGSHVRQVLHHLLNRYHIGPRAD